MTVPNRVRLSGSVVSPRTARISTDIGGLVESLDVELGEAVSAGTALIHLDAELARLDLERARAAVAEARADLDDARREVRVGKRLAAQDNLPQNQLDARQARAAMAEAALARLQAEASRFEARVRRHTIRAPFDGVVARRLAQPGEWIAPGTAVVELVDTGRLRVDVPVPQEYFPDLTDRASARVAFDAYPGRSFATTILARVPVSDPTARTFTLRLNPETGDLALTPGMSAKVVLDLAKGRQQVVIPRDAVIRHADGRTTVWVTEARGEALTVVERVVTLGRTFEGRVAVENGIAAGQSVVTRGNEGLRPGQTVRRVSGNEQEG